ncbi:WxL protein peptidoglycan domain-containing protein [Vagococcus salmoninarum]|uniref:Uncharacterized protein n=2 Tax=Vagococcus salmoninarum TaxID=2739 RepID=A0A429ZND4_9ENTE|nr:DUF916 domain-containing protein [Vagococcus salmoninarum]RST95188.1 hypothetical protein CBF35_08365 [Vagococcus salmoninarum]
MKILVKKIKLIMLFSVISCCSVLSLTTKVQAEEGIGFSYYNQIPKNQLTEGSYFDLLVKPKDKQTLITEVRNESSESITVKVSINDSKTTGTGVIDYGPSNLKNTKGLAIKLNDILTGPTEVTLKKGEVKELEFQLVVPEKSFEGVILGGIQLEKVTKNIVSKEAVSVQNKYAYAFSVSLREDKKKLAYDLNSVKSDYQVTSRGSQVTLEITNDTQEIVKDLKLSTIITALDAKEVLVEKVSDKIKMAPMSVMDYTVEFPKEAPGKYITRTTAQAGKQEWRWENEFEVLEQDQALGNQVLEDDEPGKNSLFWVVAIILTLISGTGVLFVAIRLYKKN